MTLAEFLAARLDEKEAALEDPQWGDAHGICYECGTSLDRERRAVAAMRKILALWPDPFGRWSAEQAEAARTVKDQARRVFAEIWSDHPDYKPAWAPS